MNYTDFLCSAVHFYILHNLSNDLILKNYIFNLFILVYGDQADSMSFDDLLITFISNSSYQDYLRSHNFV